MYKIHGMSIEIYVYRGSRAYTVRVRNHTYVSCDKKINRGGGRGEGGITEQTSQATKPRHQQNNVVYLIKSRYMIGQDAMTSDWSRGNHITFEKNQARTLHTNGLNICKF